MVNTSSTIQHADGHWRGPFSFYLSASRWEKSSSKSKKKRFSPIGPSECRAVVAVRATLCFYSRSPAHHESSKLKGKEGKKKKKKKWKSPPWSETIIGLFIWRLVAILDYIYRNIYLSCVCVYTCIYIDVYLATRGRRAGEGNKITYFIRVGRRLRTQSDWENSGPLSTAAFLIASHHAALWYFWSPETIGRRNRYPIGFFFFFFCWPSKTPINTRAHITI